MWVFVQVVYEARHSTYSVQVSEFIQLHRKPLILGFIISSLGDAISFHKLLNWLKLPIHLFSSPYLSLYLETAMLLADVL